MNDKKYCPLKFAYSNWDSVTLRNEYGESKIRNEFQCDKSCAWFDGSKNACSINTDLLTRNEDNKQSFRKAHGI